MSTAARPDPLDTLYRDHHGWLQGWLKRKLGNAGDAADLTQDTFLRLMCSREDTPERQAGWKLREPRAYLSVVANRLVANLYRRRSLEAAWLEALAQQPEALMPSPEEHLLILEALNELDALLDGLPPKVRAAFLLAQIEGLGYAEIAVRLELSERSVKRYMVQAMARCIVLAP
ncbi:sigma-70 family RNA polymerase sigma factor [Thauera linaloolentis]|uniref:ECF subfamily RNA polymerase sigma factor n=1 Tax=Thauera linaloolentis (strain DSM 12138 / JCM 21573 / CCUG 41526 / CIP 105981 / IAM 15112 / NBRC 102519 / 47Lol) TaxID=1123367 RepID=N6Z7F0_THAL4|nr:sigma-70 family RNA polymerase sigma factor [Thauera linaloolentis]ENO90487.1 ECF subfamily RNA polymerase sigma factor [Thauera linaloolentis 47Lol = DSM 12138]MCM8566346.1 sigma-70 family RNA polymerase sigma factor [Thauera linaloolentis]